MESKLIPPSAVDLEEVILGAMLLEKEAIYVCADILKEEYFYEEKHRVVFHAMTNLLVKNAPIDILTVTKECQRLGQIEMAGGAYGISQLTNRVSSSANIEYHSRIVHQKYLQRELIKFGNDIFRVGYSEGSDPFEMIESAYKKLNILESGINKKVVNNLFPSTKEVVDECRTALNNPDKTIGITTGIKAFDSHTNGWQKNTLNIIAGRPGMGKTSAALMFGLEAAKDGKPGVFFSLEMDRMQIAARALSYEVECPGQRIVNRQLKIEDINALEKNLSTFKELPFFIDDTPNMDLDYIIKTSRRLSRDKGIKWIIVDYLQIIKTPNSRGNREQDISNLSRSLKGLSRELEMPVIVLSQLSRRLEDRAEKKPQLSDLRESGAIEQDADNVIFCYRPEEYGAEDYSIGSNTYKAAGLFIFIIAKFRNGSRGEIKARWVNYLMKIVNYKDETVKVDEKNEEINLPF